MWKYNPNKYMKTYDHILVDTAGANFGLRYGYWDIIKWTMKYLANDMLSTQDDITHKLSMQVCARGPIAFININCQWYFVQVGRSHCQ